MSQQINLINPALRPKHNWLSFNNVAIAAAGSALLIASLAGYASVSAGRALAQQQALSTRLIAAQQDLQSAQAILAAKKADPALAREVEVVSAALAHRRNVLHLAEESASLGNVSLSDMMRGFSRQVLSGVWLTGFNVGTRGVDIRGRLLEPSLLPAYIRRLNEEPAFRGRLFAALDMQDVEPEAPKPVAGGQPAPNPLASPQVRFTEFALRASAPVAAGEKQ